MVSFNRTADAASGDLVENKTIAGESGDSIIDGGAGLDTVTYNGKPSDYNIIHNKDDSWTISDVRGPKKGASDTTKNIERIKFGDGTEYSLAPNGILNQVDFALVVDTTGSMGPYVGAVQDDATALINAAFKDGDNDARIGVVSFKDPTQGDPNSVLLSFTDQTEFSERQSAAQAAINKLDASGGGDTPETDEAGLLLALDGSMGQWRDSAGTRRIALFSDAPVKDTDLADTVNQYAHDLGVVVTTSSVSRFASGSVSTFALAANPSSATESQHFSVQIYTIQVGDDDSATDSLKQIASDNGGNFFQAPTPADLQRALLTIINTPINQPPSAGTVSDQVAYEDTSLLVPSAVILAGATDPDGGILSIAVASAINGLASIDADGNLVYVPTTGYLGPDIVTYTISDGQGGTTDATFDVTVTTKPVSTSPSGGGGETPSPSSGGGTTTPAPVPVTTTPTPVTDTPTPVTTTPEPVSPAPVLPVSSSTPVAGPLTNNSPTAVPADTVSIAPNVSYADGAFTLTGSVSSPAGVTGVEISALLDDGARQDLGAAAVNGDGTWTFTDPVGAATQSYIQATVTDGAGGSAASADAGFSLQAGLAGRTVARQDSYSADGSAIVASSLFRADGSRTVQVNAGGQTFQSGFFDTFRNGAAPDNTFVFDPGHGLDVVSGFRVDGTDHDTLSLLGSDFGGSVAEVLRNTHDVGGSAVITDPTSGDTIKLAGISKAELKANQGDFAFHA